MASRSAPSAPLYDVHSHVLFNIDDGAVDEQMALDMLRLSSERGVTGIIATPHSLDVAQHGGVGALNDRIARVRTLLRQHDVAIELMPGMEVHVTPDAPDRLAGGDYLPLNGSRYVLAELDFVQWASYADDVLFRIAVEGHTPLLAHVERIGPLQERPELVEELVQRGYFTQVTAMSLTGAMGPEARDTAETLLKRGLVHVIASDTHRPDGNREPLLASVFEVLSEMVGEDGARIMIYANPAAVVRDEPLSPIDPTPRGRRRWWFR